MSAATLLEYTLRFELFCSMGPIASKHDDVINVLWLKRQPSWLP